MIDSKVSFNDTIAAVATVPGVAGIGIIKISGPRAVDIISKVFLSSKPKNFKKVRNYTLHYGWIADNSAPSKAGDNIIDEVLIGIMRKPNSYTRQDIIEVYSHSGSLVLDKILSLVLKHGARLAEPGEFTKRAFVSGRIDLVQAESILDIVNSKTDQALKLSTLNLKGNMSKVLESLENRINELVIRIEANISFPEEDTELDTEEVIRKTRKIVQDIKSLLRNSDKARFLREGIKCVICGRSNVGKSSLLNMLLNEERVIVTPISGTTRDIVEENINIRGLPLTICDTAGILSPRDIIEEKALKKSYNRLQTADLVLLLFDSSEGLKKDDFLLAEKIKDKNTIFVLNKADLKKRIQEDKLSKFGRPLVKISALKKRGLAGLEKAIVNNVWKGFGAKRQELSLVSNIRHINLLRQAENIISESLEKVSNKAGLDYLFFCLNEAKEQICRITGKVYSQDTLESIFDRFCIGK